MTSISEVAAPRATPIRFDLDSQHRRAVRWFDVLGFVALLVVLIMLADPRGSLGTDTGGKLATLDAMQRQESWRPDVGYWAAAMDPDGLAHPLYYTQRFDDAWINVTTLPMLLAARPLHEAGGDRLALVLPIVGGVLAALAAAALARRLGARSTRRAFWLAAVASPVIVYSLDLWEHTLGLAAMAWGVVALVDAVHAVEAGHATRGTVGSGLHKLAMAGASFGLAATLRTEAFLYGAAFGFVALIVMARTERVASGRSASALTVAWRFLRRGLVASGGALVPLATNEIVERAVLGNALRSTRASAVAGTAGDSVGVRLEEGLRTAIGANYADVAVDVLVGGVLVAAVTVAVRSVARRGDGRPAARRHALEGLGAAFVVYGVRMRTGLSFVSGLLPANPMAMVGTTSGRLPHHRWLRWTAIGVVPAAWTVQYVGGAAPQWGGRYVLTSGLVLGAIGAVVLEDAMRLVRVGIATLAVGVSGYGVAHAIDRTHDAAAIADRVVAVDADIVVSRVGHVFREIGADYEPERRWLTAVDGPAIDVTQTVIDSEANDTVAVITYPDDTYAPGGYRLVESDPMQFFSEALEIRFYERGTL